MHPSHPKAILVGLLADSNELTQELASKGLSILFDNCDERTQDVILQQLVKGLQEVIQATRLGQQWVFSGNHLWPLPVCR